MDLIEDTNLEAKNHLNVPKQEKAQNLNQIQAQNDLDFSDSNTSNMNVEIDSNQQYNEYDNQYYSNISD